MLFRLQDALCDARGRYRLEACRSSQAAYLPGDSCLLRYELDVAEQGMAQTFQALVAVRIFPTPLACRRYVHHRLAPLAGRAHGRGELEPFASPVAVLTDLNATLAVFPVDGELPTLLDATDPVRVAEILGRSLPDAAAGRFDITGCRVERGHYGRRHRCVLRYEVDGVLTSSGARECRIVYGKVTAERRGALAGAALAAARESEELRARGFLVPGVLAFDPELQLLLVEALPGAPQLSQLIAARVAGEVRAASSQSGPDMTLEAAIEESARVAAALHASGIALGPRHAAADEMAGLTPELRGLRRLSPDLGELLGGWLRCAGDCLERSHPLALAFCHGDFSHTQLVFEGARCGLVDFDNVRRAEPALDLGQFLAYLRLAVLKARQPGAYLPTDFADQLSARFLDAYVAAAGAGPTAEARLRARVPAYEVISLLRLAVHSWRKFKPTRLGYALELLEERVSCLPLSTR